MIFTQLNGSDNFQVNKNEICVIESMDLKI